MSNRNSLLHSWVEKADHDLGSAILIHSHIPEYKDTIAFHCQQAAEKYIKAWMIFEEIAVRKSHDLVYLLELISEKQGVAEVWFEKAMALEGYGVEFRYPDSSILVSDSDIDEAIKIAKEFREFIVPKLNLL